ncbi:hypothetical protein MMC28_008858 [Mycoblastus sanguinarius]|nr:hypothetical protein [Mycoblastus sanguinarius]
MFSSQRPCPVAEFHKHYLNLNPDEAPQYVDTSSISLRKIGQESESCPKKFVSPSSEFIPTRRFRSKSFGDQFLCHLRAKPGSWDHGSTSLSHRTKFSASTKIHDKDDVLSTPESTNQSTVILPTPSKPCPKADPSRPCQTRQLRQPFRRIKTDKSRESEVFQLPHSEEEKAANSPTASPLLQEKHFPSKKRRLGGSMKSSLHSPTHFKSSYKRDRFAWEAPAVANTFLDRLLDFECFQNLKPNRDQIGLLFDMLGCPYTEQKPMKEVLKDGAIPSIPHKSDLSLLVSGEHSSKVQDPQPSRNADPALKAEHNFDLTILGQPSPLPLVKFENMGSPFIVLGKRLEIRKMIPFNPKFPSNASIEEHIKRALTKTLTKGQGGRESQGQIYIYWVPVNFGLVKIGRTKRLVEKRLKEWRYQCKHTPLLIYPRTPEEEQPVPHVGKVEALIHAEFRTSRRVELSCACRKKHKEWFEENWLHARNVVMKWSAWMRTDPYTEKGRLRKKHCDNLEQLSQVLPRTDETSGTTLWQPVTGPLMSRS